jgi:hypothetical protein
MSVRPWAQFGDAAYVSMWAQAYNSAQISFGGVRVCAYPALAATIQSATALAAEEDGGTLTAANALGWDLARAWNQNRLDLAKIVRQLVILSYITKTPPHVGVTIIHELNTT